MARKPDDWMPGRWLTVEPRAWCTPHNVAGVYVFIARGEVIYIGQSNNLKARFGRHNVRLGYARNVYTPWGQFREDEFICKVKLSRRLGDWAMWEIRLISRLQPRFNTLYLGKRQAA